VSLPPHVHADVQRILDSAEDDAVPAQLGEAHRGAVVVGKLEVGGLLAGLDHADQRMRSAPRATLAPVSGTLTRCRSCGRDTTTTEDWRCTYCGQPKPVTAEPVAAEAPEGPLEPESGEWGESGESGESRERPAYEPSVFEDLQPQLAAAALAGVIAIVGLLMGSSLLLIAAAAVLVVAVVAKIVADGW
jgi:hypothetical protein